MFYIGVNSENQALIDDQWSEANYVTYDKWGEYQR